MPELILILAGGLITLITQRLKPYTKVNPLLIAATLSLLGGLLYAGLEVTGHWQKIKEFMMIAYPMSVLIYQFIKQAMENDLPTE